MNTVKENETGKSEISHIFQFVGKILKQKGLLSLNNILLRTLNIVPQFGVIVSSEVFDDNTCRKLIFSSLAKNVQMLIQVGL